MPVIVAVHRSQLEGLLVASLPCRIMWSPLVQRKLVLMEKAFRSYPARTIWVLCPKCIVSSSNRKYHLPLGDNPRKQQQLILLRESLRISWPTTWKWVSHYYGSWGVLGQTKSHNLSLTFLHNKVFFLSNFSCVYFCVCIWIYIYMIGFFQSLTYYSSVFYYFGQYCCLSYSFFVILLLFFLFLIFFLGSHLLLC